MGLRGLVKKARKGAGKYARRGIMAGANKGLKAAGVRGGMKKLKKAFKPSFTSYKRPSAPSRRGKIKK
mgnify:FL=1